MTNWRSIEGTPFPLGATWLESEGVYNFALYSKHAQRVELLLFEERDAHGGGGLDLPDIGFVVSREHPHQRGLAAAVGADETDTFPRAHVEGHVPADRIAIELPSD